MEDIPINYSICLEKYANKPNKYRNNQDVEANKSGMQFSSRIYGPTFYEKREQREAWPCLLKIPRDKVQGLEWVQYYLISSPPSLSVFTF